MRKVIIGLFLLCFVTAMAGSIIEHPTEPQDNPWFYEMNYTGDDADQAQVGVAPEVKGITDYSEIAPPSGVQYNGPDMGESGDLLRWGDDVLIMSHGLPTFGKLSTDQDEQNGDMYASLLVPHSGYDDTVYTYRSTDGGLTWQYLMVQNGGASTGGIKDHEILVGYDGTDAWIYSYCLYDNSGTMGGIWVLRIRPGLTGGHWTQIIQDGSVLDNFSVDRNIETPQHMFIIWQTTAGHIDMESSSDYSLTWGNHRSISSNSRNVSVCAGGDGYVYIAYQIYDSTDIQVGRYTNNLISPSYHFELIQSNIYGNFNPSVAAGRTTPGSSQIAWVLYRQMNSIGNASIRYSHTTDGGASWAAGTPWPVTNIGHTTWDMKYPYARVSYNSGLLRAVATIPETGPDSVVYAFSRTTSPTTWEDRGVYNDHGITSEYGARVEHSYDCSGGYLVYREYASRNIWCDAFDFSGIDEDIDIVTGSPLLLSPNPSNGIATLSYAIEREGNVQISLHDVTGRMVKGLLNENKKAGRYSVNLNNSNLSSGIYFVHMETSGGVYTQKMTVVK